VSTAVLLLRLAAPLQSWGSASRYGRRNTDSRPTKSAVLGLLAAAQGRRRSDPVADLAGLRFGVRVDQPGVLLRDFHTVSGDRWPDRRLPTAAGGRRPLDTSTQVTKRYYLADAVFLAAVEGDPALITTLADALRHPAFPLFLGRRSCPPATPPLLRIGAGPLEATLAAEPWHAAAHHRRHHRAARVTLAVTVDDPAGGDSACDVPVSFAAAGRVHGWRRVRHDTVTVTHPDPPHSPPAGPHDPFLLLTG
jgi:CRISPR system Cascade subunit CasD